MKLLPKITSLLLLILIPILAILAYEEIRKERRVLYSFLNKQGHVLKTTISAGTVEALLVNDYPLLDTYLGRVVQNYDTMYLIELEKDGETISSVVNNKLKHDKIKYFEHDIRLYGDTIAKLKFGLSTKPTEDTINNKIKGYISNSIIVLLILFFSLLFIIKKFLLRYINELKHNAQIIGSGNYKHFLNINTKDEFHDLANSMNQMSQNIYESAEKSKRLTKELENQKRELILANKSKDMFLANMSHELKTPLNSINVISSVMKKDKEKNLSEKQIENLNVINMCGQNLLFLINDVLDISKLEAGEITLNYETFNFKDTIEDIKLMIQPQAKEKNICFEVSLDKNIDYIYSDENRLKQIIKNLLSNALKFAPEGNIQLIVKSLDRFIEVEIIDNGIGIEESKISDIFDRFKQVDGSTTRKFGGTGLGLSISKELSKLLKGNLSVTSKFGHGSTFTLKFPKNLNMVKKTDTLISLKEKSKNKEKEKILVFNDCIIDLMRLIIKLNKSYQVKNISNIEDLDQEINKDYKYMIINETLLDLEKLKNIKLKKIIVCEDIDKLNEDYKNISVKVFNKIKDDDKIVLFIDEN